MRPSWLSTSLLLFSATAQAAPITGAAETDVVEEEESRSHFGIEVAAGLPDALSASILVRPWMFLELRAGGAYNLVSFGIQGGITLVPFDTVFRPLLTLEGGHYFPGDANKLAGMISGDDAFSSPLLKQVSYSWANAHLGFDLGVDLFRFFLRGGISYLRAPISAEGINAMSEDGSITVGRDPILSGFIPSAKLGFSSYLF